MFPQACGVDFEVKGFCAENLEEKIHKRYFQGIPFLPHGPKTKPQDLFGVTSLWVRLRTFCQPMLGWGTLPETGAVVPVSCPKSQLKPAPFGWRHCDVHKESL